MLNLVSDSSCDLISGELNSPYARLTVAPMCLHVGGQDYLDTPELDIPALLSKLAHHRSSSACPSPAAYAEAFEQGEETVCVTISSQLSGSYNAAMAAPPFTGASIQTFEFPLSPPLNLPAPGRRQPIYVIFRFSIDLCFW